MKNRTFMDAIAAAEAFEETHNYPGHAVSTWLRYVATLPRDAEDEVDPLPDTPQKNQAPNPRLSEASPGTTIRIPSMFGLPIASVPVGFRWVEIYRIGQGPEDYVTWQVQPIEGPYFDGTTGEAKPKSAFTVMADALREQSVPPKSGQELRQYLRNDLFRTLARALEAADKEESS